MKSLHHIRLKIAELLYFFNHQNTNILYISNFAFYKLFCIKEILKSNNIQSILMFISNNKNSIMFRCIER